MYNGKLYDEAAVQENLYTCWGGGAGGGVGVGLRLKGRGGSFIRHPSSTHLLGHCIKETSFTKRL